MSRTTSIGATALAVITALALSAPGAQAKPLRSIGAATVKSVDGPGLLTITVGRRTVPVRLHDVDLPRDGECGAAETTAALGGFVRRAPRNLSYALVKTKTGFRRDPDGRFQAILAYRGSRAWRDLGDDLLRTGWGREGEAATGADGPRQRGIVPEGARSAGSGGDDDGGSDGSAATAKRIGRWAVCGGRVHLPAGEPVAPTSSPVWNVDASGIATSIGPLVLSATLTPSGSLTLGGLAATAPVEYSHWFFGCKASIPSLQLEAWAASSSGSCAQAPVLLLRPEGPDPARLSRGGGVGLPVSQARAGYPLLDLDNPAGWLSGDRRQWAWQVAASTGEQEDPVVDDLTTYQAALLPDR